MAALSKNPNVSLWLKGLRLHKYSNLFESIQYEDMLGLNDKWLETQGVTKGARNKILISIHSLHKRQENLRRMEKEVLAGNVRPALAELRQMLYSPIKAFVPPSASTKSTTAPEASMRSLAAPAVSPAGCLSSPIGSAAASSCTESPSSATCSARCSDSSDLTGHDFRPSTEQDSQAGIGTITEHDSQPVSALSSIADSDLDLVGGASVGPRWEATIVLDGSPVTLIQPAAESLPSQPATESLPSQPATESLPSQPVTQSGSVRTHQPLSKRQSVSSLQPYGPLNTPNSVQTSTQDQRVAQSSRSQPGTQSSVVQPAAQVQTQSALGQSAVDQAGSARGQSASGAGSLSEGERGESSGEGQTESSQSSPSEGDSIAEGDLPGQITRVLGKICTQLLVTMRPDAECLSGYMALLDRCIGHQAFAVEQMKKMKSWRFQIERVWHYLSLQRHPDRHRLLGFSLSASPPGSGVLCRPTLPPAAPSHRALRGAGPQLSTPSITTPTPGQPTWTFGGRPPLPGPQVMLRQSPAGEGTGTGPPTQAPPYLIRPAPLQLSTLKQPLGRTQSAPMRSDHLPGLSAPPPAPVSMLDVPGAGSSDDIDASLDSLCISMMEHALGPLGESL